MDRSSHPLSAVVVTPPAGSDGDVPPESESLRRAFEEERRATVSLLAPLLEHLHAVTAVADLHSIRWQLAITSWALERLVLRSRRGYRSFERAWPRAANAYYQRLKLFGREAAPGGLVDTLRYRAHADAAMSVLFEHRLSAMHRACIARCIVHERLHRELLLAHLKRLYWRNPALPVYALRPSVVHGPLRHDGSAAQAVSNAQYREFIRDGAYRDARLWSAHGWSFVRRGGWQRPLYWSPALDAEHSLYGELALDDTAAVCHLSFFEAQAYACWSGTRLPTEPEWLALAARRDRAKLPADSAPEPVLDAAGHAAVWNWTARPADDELRHEPCRPLPRARVLRGGSCVIGAPDPALRTSCAPEARHRFSGLSVIAPALH